MARPNFLRNIFAALIIGASFLSCSGNIDVTLKQNHSAEVKLSSALGKNLVTFIRTFSYTKDNLPILDAASLNLSLKKTQGVSAVNLKNATPDSIEGTISLSRVEDFLLSPEQSAAFIRFAPPGQGNATGSFSMYLDRASGPKILSYFSIDLSDYLSALMAPIATGEKLSKSEFLSLVTSVYGAPLAAEINAAKIEGYVHVPGKIREVTGGKFDGSRARIEVPIVDILVLERPWRWELKWTQ